MERKKVAKAAELEEDALIVEYLRQRQLKEQVIPPFHNTQTPLSTASRALQTHRCQEPNMSNSPIHGQTSMLQLRQILLPTLRVNMVR